MSARGGSRFSQQPAPRQGFQTSTVVILVVIIVIISILLIITFISLQTCIIDSRNRVCPTIVADPNAP